MKNNKAYAFKNTYLVRATVNNGSSGIILVPPEFKIQKNNVIKRLYAKYVKHLTLQPIELSMNLIVALNENTEKAKQAYNSIVNNPNINAENNDIWCFASQDEASTVLAQYQIDIVNRLKNANIDPKPLYDLNLTIIKGEYAFTEIEGTINDRI